MDEENYQIRSNLLCQILVRFTLRPAVVEIQAVKIRNAPIDLKYLDVK